jgi:hypothetical protein
MEDTFSMSCERKVVAIKGISGWEAVVVDCTKAVERAKVATRDISSNNDYFNGIFWYLEGTISSTVNRKSMSNVELACFRIGKSRI